MQTMNLEEAQSRLAEIIEKLAPDEEIVLMRNNQPVARLVGGLGEKPRPVPVNITQRTLASAAHLSRTSQTSSIISSDMALSLSGRLRRMRPMPSVTVNSSVV